MGLRRVPALAGATVLAVVGADVASKVLVRSDLARGGERELVGQLVQLVHVENAGVAFGQLSHSPLLIAGFVAAALAGLLVYFARHQETDAVWLPTGMLVGGAIGNALDRARGGAVTDFVKVPYWPAFNVADIAITLGVIVLVIVVERDTRDRDEPEEPRGHPDHS